MAGCHVKPEQMFNLIFGYNDRVTDYAVKDSSATGFLDQVFPVVGPDVIYVVQAIWCQPRESATAVAYMGIKDGTNPHWIGASGVLAQYEPYTVTGQFVLKQGDQVLVSVMSGGDTKEFWMGYWGYKMKLVQ